MNNAIDRIEPLDSDQKQRFLHSAFRLISAQEELHRFYHGHPVYPDIFVETEAVSAWKIITLSYSGIEQTMKCLLKMQDAFIDRPHRRGGDRHHDIGKLFRRLTSDEQRILHVSYTSYRSLHDYIPLQTVDSFLEAIDDGYQKWRYFLLDGDRPPTTHCGAMLEVWSSLSDILKAKVFTKHGLCTVERRIYDLLDQWVVRDAWDEHTHPYACKCEIEDVNRWIQSYDNNFINACADLFHHHANDAIHLLEVSPSILPVLRTGVDIAERHKNSDQDFAYFLQRIKANNLTWNPLENRFENVSQ